MKELHGKYRFKQNVIFVCLVFAICIFVVSCSKWQSGYSGFIKHDKRFYSDIASGCEALLAQTNQTADWWVLNGNDKSLPASLTDLNATTIKVAKHQPMDTNNLSAIIIIFGAGRPEFVVSWQQRDSANGSQLWELSVDADVNHTVVFSK